MIKNNYACDVKYITTCTNQLPLDLKWRGQPKKAPKGAYFHQGPLQRYKKK